MIEPEGSITETPVTTAQSHRSTFIVGTVLLVFAGWNVYRGRTAVVAVLGVAGVALLLIGMLSTSGARILHRAWMKFAAALGYVNSRVLLTLLYLIAVTPYGLLSRLVGRDALKRRGSSEKSYWFARGRTRQSKEEFGRLF